MGLLDLFKKKGSSDVAKDRLKLLLVSDRDRKSTRLNSSHTDSSRMPSSA